MRIKLDKIYIRFNCLCLIGVTSTFKITFCFTNFLVLQEQCQANENNTHKAMN